MDIFELVIQAIKICIHRSLIKKKKTYSKECFSLKRKNINEYRKATTKQTMRQLGRKLKTMAAS